MFEINKNKTCLKYSENMLFYLKLQKILDISFILTVYSVRPLCVKSF